MLCFLYAVALLFILIRHLFGLTFQFPAILILITHENKATEMRVRSILQF